MVKKVLDKEELIARLKELSAQTTRYEIMGAMCYSPVRPPIEHTKCEMCGADIVYANWLDERNKIYETVRNISNLGYDAKVEVCCMKCAETLAKDLQLDDEAQQDDEINYLFSFRLKDGDRYHSCIANSVEQYKSLLSLLCNDVSYYDNYDSVHYIADEKDVLKYMTGIDFNG